VFVHFETNIIGGPKSMSNEDLLRQGQFLRMENMYVAALWWPLARPGCEPRVAAAPHLSDWFLLKQLQSIGCLALHFRGRIQTMAVSVL
jgi:hypothetical protein